MLNATTALFLGAVVGVQAAADTAPLYTPCLADHQDLPGFSAEMEAAGWLPLAPDSSAWSQAVTAAAQPHSTMLLLPGRFETTGDVFDYIERTSRRAQSRFRNGTAVFQRGDASAVIELIPVGETQSVLSCIFAAFALQDVTEILEGADQSDALAFQFATLDHPEIEAGDELRVTALRFSNTPIIDAMLAGREGILVSRYVEAHE